MLAGQIRYARAAVAPLLALILVPVAAVATSLAAARELHLAGRLAAADAAYRQLLGDPATPPDDRATAANNLCVLLLGEGTYAGAEPICRDAVELRRRQLAAIPAGTPPADQARLRIGLARALNNRGLVAQYLGDHPAGEAAFGEALGLNRELGEVASQAINQANLGLLLTAAGRYREALAAHQAAAALASAHADTAWAPVQAATAALNQGVVLERLGLYPAALAALREAAERREVLPATTQAALAVNTAVVLRNLGDPVAARAALVAAAATYRTAGDRAALANVELNLGMVAAWGFRDPAGARNHLAAAVQLARESGDGGEESRARYELGRLALAAGDLATAEAELAGCLAAARTAATPEGVWSAEAGLGEVAAARGDLDTALEHLGVAIETIEALRTTVEPGPLRWGFFGDKRSVFATAVRIRLARAAEGDVLAALWLAQQAKARELLDALGVAEPGLTGREEGPTGDRLAEITDALGEGDALLEQMVTADTLYSWLVDRHGARALPPQPLAPLAAAAARLYRALANGGGPAGDALAADLALLGAGLLPGAGDGGAPGYLFIAADGPFRRIPFELLPLPEPHAAGDRLIDRGAIAYLPNGAALPGLRSRPDVASPATALLAFAAPASGLGLPSLPAAAGEAARAARLLPGSELVLTGAQATPAAWRREIGRGARVVHVAAHALAGDDPLRGAGLVLAAEPGTDGFLGARELAAAPLRADLVVLAGCRTGAVGGGDEPDAGPGEEAPGTALLALTGGLLAAGAPSLVVSLWEVGDATTAIFMEQLYFDLGHGATVGDALRAAKQRLRRDPAWNREALWGAFVVVGDPSRRVAPQAVPRRLWWLALVAGLLAVAGLARVSGLAGRGSARASARPRSVPPAGAASG